MSLKNNKIQEKNTQLSHFPDQYGRWIRKMGKS